LEIINRYGIYKRKNDYKMYCSFSHIFGWGYAAWYYSYIWAEILEADVFGKIKEMWMFDSKTGKFLLETIIGQWTRKKASELFFDFMWRKVSNEAFLERYGLKK
jgi:Zn-dependent oligopeptidase